MDNRENRNNSITVGVFTAELNDSYQVKLWEGIVSSAREKGVGLISFLGSRLNSPIPQEASSNVIYRMAGTENIDGLIIISSAISTYLDFDEVKALFAQRSDLPQVSVGLDIPGVLSITVDGRDGMTDVVEHLIEIHKRRHFAIITGPQGHEESEARKLAIFDTLNKYNIPIYDYLIRTGTFEKDSGVLAAQSLIDQNKKFDALICLNDQMAIGAYETLSNSGICIPDDVSLIGFDGLEEAESTPLPLTTVHQPILELGASALEEVVNLIEGNTATSRILECTPLYGESCGCKNKLIPDKTDLDEFEAEMTSYERKMYLKLQKHLQNPNQEKFISTLRSLINRQIIDTHQRHKLNNMLYLLQNRMLSGFNSFNSDSISKISSLFTQGFTLIGESYNRVQSVKHYAMKERFSIARSVGVSVSEAFEVPMIFHNLAEGLSRLGFEDAYMVLFTDEDPEYTRGKLFHLTDTQNYSDFSEVQAIEYDTFSILPKSINVKWKTRLWILIPLVFQAEPLGYLLLPANVLDAAIYDMLSKQIASTLKGTQLLDRVRSHEKNLEREVSRRTAELININEKLKEEIDTRIRLEQEVVDISNKTMNRIGQDLHDDLCQHLAGISMIVTALKKSLPSETRASDIADQINSLVVDSIDRTKGIVRGLVPLGLEEHGLGVAIDALVEAVGKSHRMNILFDKEDDFSIPDLEQSIQLYRIVQEAISNAVKHSGCSSIDVRLYSQPAAGNEKVKRVERIVEVSDNGKGISENIQSMGMGLKIMKYRAEKANAILSIKNNNKGGASVICRILREI